MMKRLSWRIKPYTYAGSSPTAVLRATTLWRKGVGKRCSTSTTARVRSLAANRDLVIVPMPEEPHEFARLLYATLHALDQRGLERIVVDPPPAGEEWQAVLDRLTRAAAGGDARS